MYDTCFFFVLLSLINKKSEKVMSIVFHPEMTFLQPRLCFEDIVILYVCSYEIVYHMTSNTNDNLN